MTCGKDCTTCCDACDGCPYGHDKRKCAEVELMKRIAAEGCYFDRVEGQE